MKTTMKVVNGVRVAASQRDPQGGRSGSVNGLSSAEITKLLGVKPISPMADGKVTKEWTFTLDGVECSMWDYKGSAKGTSSAPTVQTGCSGWCSVRPTWQEPANMTTFEMTVLTRKGFKMPIVVVAEGVDVLRTTFIDGEPFHPTTAQREVIGQEAFDRSGRVVCAWCKIVLAEGEVDAPVSHGICAKCAQEMES